MAAKRELATIPADKLALYEKLLATRPDIEKKGANVPYTSVNGYMCTYLSEDGALRIRLSKEECEEFIATHGANHPVAYGITQKDFVEVPEALLKKTEELQKYLDKSYAHAMGLKPKATKKKA